MATRMYAIQTAAFTAAQSYTATTTSTLEQPPRATDMVAACKHKLEVITNLPTKCGHCGVPVEKSYIVEFNQDIYCYCKGSGGCGRSQVLFKAPEFQPQRTYRQVCVFESATPVRPVSPIYSEEEVQQQQQQLVEDEEQEVTETQAAPRRLRRLSSGPTPITETAEAPRARRPSIEGPVPLPTFSETAALPAVEGPETVPISETAAAPRTRRPSVEGPSIPISETAAAPRARRPSIEGPSIPITETAEAPRARRPSVEGPSIPITETAEAPRVRRLSVEGPIVPPSLLETAELPSVESPSIPISETAAGPRVRRLSVEGPRLPPSVTETAEVPSAEPAVYSAPTPHETTRHPTFSEFRAHPTSAGRAAAVPAFAPETVCRKCAKTYAEHTKGYDANGWVVVSTEPFAFPEEWPFWSEATQTWAPRSH